ncbi:MAG: hypothetical protein AAF360_12895 [Pseudomonadota bacterium]
MRQSRQAFRLLMAGLPPRLAGAASIIVALWLGFLWATGALGS